MKVKLTKIAAALVMTAAISCTSLTASANNAVDAKPSSNSGSDVVSAKNSALTDNLEEFSVTLSVEDFADLAEDYGCSVTIGNDDIAEPQKHEEGSYTFTDVEWHQIGSDVPLINEQVQLQNIRFGSNVKYVQVGYAVRTDIQITKFEKEIYNGGYSDSFFAPFGTKYRIFMRVIPKSGFISKSNPCKVTYYWTDRGWELI